MDSRSITTDTSKGSSSHMENGKVTILCHPKEQKLKQKIEEVLHERNYDVVEPLIAGRNKVDNFMSCIHHAKYKIILLTNRWAKSLQDYIAPAYKPGFLTSYTTLVMCQENIKKKDIKSYLRNFVCIKMAKTGLEIATSIMSYIEANDRAGLGHLHLLRSIKYLGTQRFHPAILIDSAHGNLQAHDVKQAYLKLKLRLTDSEERKHLCVALLLANVFKEKEGMHFDELRSRVSDIYGNFPNMQVGYLHEFIAKQDIFTFDNQSNMVKLTGDDFVEEWLETVRGLSEEGCRDEEQRTDRERAVVSESSQSCAQVVSQVVLDKTETKQADEQPVQHWVETTASKQENTAVDTSSSSMKFLAEHLSKFDSRFGYFLITSRLPDCDSDHYKGIANIPWLRVFDFDTESRRHGLLLAVEKLISSERNLSISTLNDPPRTLSDKATDWLFMRGFSDKPGTISSEIPMKWLMQYSKILDILNTAQVEYCFCKKLPVCLILWYDDDRSSSQYLQLFLMLLQQKFACKSDKLPLKIVVCIPEGMESKKSPIQESITLYDLQETTCSISLPIICKYLANVQSSSKLILGNMKLPKRCEDGSKECVCIEDANLPWVKDYVDLLSLEDKLAEFAVQRNIGEDFLKGGTVAWDELQRDTIAVERDIQQDFLEKVKKEYIDECRSTVIRIYHTPGGGGTTFGRQILWKLRKCAPCGVVVLSPSLSTSELAQRLEFLHNLTQLPVVLLVDGGSDHEVELIYANRTFAVVILHVQRYSLVGRRSGYEPGKPCFLSEVVTSGESEKFASLFSKFAPRYTSALHSLHKRAATESKVQVFEFGLTAFHHNFKGVRSYVRGYLGPHSTELTYWKKIILFLSVLKYFGQVGMPRQVFVSLVPEADPFVSLDDLKLGKNFIVETPELEWRINYHAVAKEIIENILSVEIHDHEANRLSTRVREKLHETVIEFIRLLGDIDGRQCNKVITDPLYTIILKRDYQDVDAKDNMQKARLSRLLDSVIEEERENILRELVKAFPSEAEFHAHLGRYLSFIQKFEEAEGSLQKALEILTSEKDSGSKNWSDNQFGRIHHMFGNSLTKRVQREMGCNQLGMYVATHSCQHSPNQILLFAKQAVKHFSEGRNFAVTHRNYGYVGEVKVRLMVVEFAVKTHEKCIEKVFANALGPSNAKLAEFVRDSHWICDRLLAECYQTVSKQELRGVSDYSQCISFFYKFFGETTRLPRAWREDDASIALRRSNIAAIKYKYFNPVSNYKKSRLPVVDDIRDKADVKQIVHLHEKTFEDVLRGNTFGVKISMDMQEWIDAIRHLSMDDTYTLAFVHEYVEMWNKKDEFGYSLFYLCVLSFLLAVSSPGSAVRQKYLKKYIDHHKQLRDKSKHSGLKRGCKEVLAQHEPNTIRKLIPVHKTGWNQEAKTFKHSENLKVCTGTVIQSGNPLIGFISLDADIFTPGKELKIYFVPKPYDLYGKRFSDRSARVEFFIGFSIDHGAEALGVKELHKHRCPTCHIDTEMTTLNQDSGFRMCCICRRQISFASSSYVTHIYNSRGIAIGDGASVNVTHRRSHSGR